MSKTRDTGYLANVIQVHDTGVRIMSGSTMLMAVSSSGAVTITGEISGSDAANALLLSGTGSVGFTTTSSFLAVSSSQQEISASYISLSGSYISLSGSYNTFSGSASTRITENSSSIQQVSSSQQQISSSLLNVISVFATTGSNSFRATQSITGSLTVTGQIIAQTLNVQQVTSSIIYSSGSNIFGCDLNSRQVFTGSFYQTGSNAYFSNCVAIGVGNFPVTGALDIRNTIQPSKQISLNTQCGSGTYLGLYTDQESFFNLTNSSACANNKVWRIGTPAATPNVLTIQNLNDAGTSICGTPMTISACGRVTVCNTLGAAAVDLNPIFACPTNAAVGYGMFGFSGIGLGIASAGTGANQGIAFFTCGDFERLRITTGGVSCFSGAVCTPNLISTDATHTTLRISCAIVPLANYRTSDCGYGGIDFFDNGKGYQCAAKFYTFKSVSTAEYYGLTNDYNGSAQLSLVSCGNGAGNNISFFTGTSNVAKMRIDNIATCIYCQLSVGPVVIIGNQGGTDTTVLTGGSGQGSALRMNYAGGCYNNYLAGNGDNYFNCLLGKLNAAGGVKYGGGATTLNYYEEGSWTPALQNATVSYGSRSGTYARIGNYVFVRWGFLISSISGTSGTVTISGLPFTSVSWGSYQEPNISVSTGVLATADNAFKARVFVAGTSTSLVGRISNNGDTPWETNQLQNGSWIIGEIFYNV